HAACPAAQQVNAPFHGSPTNAHWPCDSQHTCGPGSGHAARQHGPPSAPQGSSQSARSDPQSLAATSMQIPQPAQPQLAASAAAFAMHLLYVFVHLAWQSSQGPACAAIGASTSPSRATTTVSVLIAGPGP